jgi:hypothetical protein
VDEPFDLPADPLEMANLAYEQEHAERARQMSARMFALLAETNGSAIPHYPDRGPVSGLRAPGDERASPFPPVFVARPQRRS